ncbi:MAG: hypothetical protein ACRYFY_18995 [Janthinobacterium lividum]
MKRHIWIMPASVITALALGSVGASADTGQPSNNAPVRAASLDPTAAETVDATALSRPLDTMPLGVPPAASLVMQASAQTLQPAPLPNEDFDAPGLSAQALAAQDQASVQPNFYGRPKPFSGDGFAAGSTIDDDRMNRHRTGGGGMSLSIPVQ